MTEQHKFKVGDRARCVVPHCPTRATCPIAEGTVSSVSGRYLRFEETGTSLWGIDRFEPLPSPSQPASQWTLKYGWWDGGHCPHYSVVQPDSPGHQLFDKGKHPHEHCPCGLTYAQAVERGFIPRDSAEAPKEQPIAAALPSVDETLAELHRRASQPSQGSKP